jgi:hypothetical protein
MPLWAGWTRPIPKGTDVSTELCHNNMHNFYE